MSESNFFSTCNHPDVAKTIFSIVYIRAILEHVKLVIISPTLTWRAVDLATQKSSFSPRVDPTIAALSIRIEIISVESAEWTST